MAPKRTELAPLVVERVAARIADQQRHRANRLGVFAMIALLGALPALALGAPLGVVVVMPSVLGGGLYMLSRRRRQAESDARAVLALARDQPELAWSLFRGAIEAHGPDGGRPVALLEDAIPRADEHLMLPAARVIKKDT